MIHYVRGDATRPVAAGQKIIVHVVNTKGAWGKGFVLGLSKRWSRPEAFYRHLFAQGKKPQLGDIHVLVVEPDTVVVNMVAQDGLPTRSKRLVLNYRALQTCLEKLRNRLVASDSTASIHLPRIGCGLGGSSWDMVEQIIKKTIGERFEVTVYDE